MMLQVRVSLRAEHDVDAVYRWLADRSPQGAARWFQKYCETLHMLPILAAGCPVAPEADRLGFDLRYVSFKTRKGRVYRSLFVIEGEVIHVLAVRGSGQDLATLEDLDLSDSP